MHLRLLLLQVNLCLLCVTICTKSKRYCQCRTPGKIRHCHSSSNTRWDKASASLEHQVQMLISRTLWPAFLQAPTRRPQVTALYRNFKVEHTIYVSMYPNP